MDAFEIAAKLQLDSKGFQSDLKKSESTFKTFGSQLKTGFANAAKVAAVGIGAAVTAVGTFAVSAVNAGKDFDKSMSQVAATMGMTTKDIAENINGAGDKFNMLRDFAREMGATTAFSAQDAADALNFMALAGYDVATSMDMLPTVLNLAAAGGIDLAYASDMVTDASSALGLSIDETTQLVDKMAVASSKSNTSVAQLGEAILTVGGTAKDIKGGTTELAAVLGVLADNGIKGAEGGTALRNIMLQLEAPTDKAAGVMENLGLKVHDAEGNMRSIPDIFGDLNDKLSTMTQGERTQVLAELFNKVDLKSVNALLGTNKDRWEELIAAIEDAQGAAENMAEVQLDNLEGDITKFKSALGEAQITISDKLTPTLRDFVQFGTDAVSKLTTAFKEDGLNGAMEALGGIITEGSAKILEGLPTFIDAGMQLLGAVASGIIANMPQIVTAAQQIGATVIANISAYLNANFPVLGQAFDTVTTAINNVTAAFQDVTGTEAAQTTFKTTIDTIWGAINATISGVAGVIKTVSDNFTTLFTQGGGEGPSGFQTVITSVFGAVNEVISGVSAVVSTILTDLTKLFAVKDEPNSFQTLMNDVFSAVNSVMSGVSDAIGDITEAFTDLYGNEENLTAFQGVVSSAFGLIGDAIKGAGTIVSQLIRGFGNLFKKADDSGEFQGTLETVFGAVKGVIDSAREAVNTIVTWFQNLWGEKDNATVFQEAISSAFGLVNTVVSGVGTVVSQLITGFKNLFKQDEKTNAFSSVVQTAFGAVRDIFDAVKGAIDNVITWLHSLFDNQENASAFSTAVESAFKLVKTIINGVKDAIVIVITWFGSLFKKDAEAGNFSEAIQGFFQSVADIFAAVSGAIETVIGWFGDLFDNQETANTFSIAVESAFKLIKSIINGIKDAIVIVITWFNSLFKKDTEANTFSTAINGFFQGVADIFEAVRGAVESVITWFSNLFNEQGTADSFSKAVESSFKLIKTIVGGIKDAIVIVITWFTSLFNKEDKANIFSTAVQGFFGLVSGAADLISSAIETVIGWFTSLFEQDGLADTAMTAIAGAFKFVSDAADAIWSAVKSAVEWLGSLFGYDGKSVNVATKHTTHEYVVRHYSTETEDVEERTYSDGSVAEFVKDKDGQGGGSSRSFASGMFGGQILRGATVFGVNSNGNMMVGGGEGPEAVVGVNSLGQMITDAVTDAVNSAFAVIASAGGGDGASKIVEQLDRVGSLNRWRLRIVDNDIVTAVGDLTARVHNAAEYLGNVIQLSSEPAISMGISNAANNEDINNILGDILARIHNGIEYIGGLIFNPSAMIAALREVADKLILAGNNIQIKVIEAEWHLRIKANEISQEITNAVRATANNAAMQRDVLTNRLIDRIGEKLDSLAETIAASQPNIVLDSGTLVGELAPVIDDELNRLAEWKGGGRA